jgi:hypothetical protein
MTVLWRPVSRNPGADRDVSRSDDTNNSTPAHLRMRGISLRAARRMLAGAGEEFGQSEPVVIADHQRDTKPASVPIAISFGDANPGTGVRALRLPAELGHVRLAPDGMGARRRPVCHRDLPGAPSDDGRRTVLVGRDGASHELCACQLG